MEYVDLVSRIVTAEHSAKELVQEAKERESHLQEDLDREIAAMRESYTARAERRLELVRQTEQAAAVEAMAAMDVRLEQSMAAVEASYERNRERWVDTLFTMIVGVQP